MKVLITGSNGLIGTALKQALFSAGINYDVVERASDPLSSLEVIHPLTSGPTRYRVAWPAGLAGIPYSQYSTVIHLALTRPTPKTPLSQAVAEQTKPLMTIIDGISRSSSDCSLLFLSSQSASAEATSAYGKGKWECEDILRKARIKWTIVRPGLIVSDNTKGLIGSIRTLLQWLPIVPVPCGSRLQVQPILLSDVITASLKIISQPLRHASCSYDLALPPRTLSSFIRQMCRSSHIRRVILPLPWKFVDSALHILEYLPFRLPVSRANLEGLLASRQMDTEAATTALTMKLTDYPATAESGLNLEANRIFLSMFGFAPPPEVVARYTSAQTDHLLNGAWIDIDSIILNQLDIEAIEFASRRKKTILSQKVQIMCYIAEQSPALLPLFINSNSARVRAFAELGVAGLRSAWKLIYGSYLLKKYKLLEVR